MCFMCKLVGHWVADCTDGSNSQVWVSDYTFVSAENAGAVDTRGVNLVGVGDPSDPHAPDFMASEATLLAVSGTSAGPGSGVTGVAGATPTSGDSSGAVEASGSSSGATHSSSTTPAGGDTSETSGSGIGLTAGTSGTPTDADTGAASGLLTGSTVGSTTTPTGGLLNGGGGLSTSSSGATVDTTSAHIDVQLNGSTGQQGAAPAGPTTSLTTTQAGAQIDRDGYHWNTNIDQPLTISFGFRTVAPSYTVGGEDVAGTFTPLTAAEQTAAVAALTAWAAIANITLVNLGNSDSATIEFANYSSSTDGAEAFTFLPSPPGDPSAASSQGDVFVNTFYAATSGKQDSPLGYVYMTLIHETGHALGLEHPSNYNSGSGTLTYANNASYIQDDRQYSVMSYFGEGNTGAWYNGKYAETPMIDDVAAIQRLYGANTTAAAGDTVYGFNSNAGSVYSITASTQLVVFNVWDTGGNDTFDFSGYTQAQTINLNAESFSSVGGLVDNVSISLGVTIENAIGGSGGDTIIGNSANNALTGGTGNDTITGGSGNDTIDGGLGTNTAVYSGAKSAYAISVLGNGNVQVSGGTDGTDTLTNIQFLQFSDQTISTASIGAPTNHAPVVTGIAASLRPGQTIAASSIFSASDPDGDTITQYQITDATTGGATLLLNGVAQAENTPIIVTAAQLVQLQIQSSATGGTNAFTIQAFDGTVWSSATNVNVATNETASAVTVTGALQLMPGQVFGVTAANLPITVSDADGDPVVTYRFTDVGSGAASASLIFNGTAVAQGGSVDVPVAQLANLSVQGGSGSGTESLQVQVYDGYQWSAAQTISVVTDTAPTVAAAATNVRPNQTVAASSIFSVSDADGDTITQYKITDATTGGAHLLLNGVQQAENTAIAVTAAQLAQLQVQGSATAGTNAFTIQAFDGLAWSNATTVTLSTNETAPSLTVSPSLLLTPGQALAVNATNLPITVTDADGDPAVTYRFIDVGAGSTSASLIFNGTAVAQGGSVDVAAAQLANLSIQGGSVAGTDTVQVQVFDGYLWSTTKSVAITTNTPPTVTPLPPVLHPNQTVSASTIFSTTDADGNPITQYKIGDMTTGGAHLLLNGVQQAESTMFTINAANLSQWQIVGSATSGANTFNVKAFDGIAWSNVASVNLNTAETASTVTVTGSMLVTPGQVLGLTTSNLPISVTDADGDPIVTYRFTDVGTASTSASLIFNGAAVAQGGSIDVAAAQLSSVSIQGASVNGSDALQVQVYDGYQWSTAQNISVVSYIDHAPVVTAVPASLRPGQTIAASLLYNVSDADGDTITQYQITDATAGGAHLLLNGVQQAENTPITVTAAQLPQLLVQSSLTGGTNTFSVQAYDGTAWSSATSVNLTTLETPSTVTVTGALQLTPGQTLGVTISNLPITVTDADGDPVVIYRFTDVGSGSTSASLIFNGAAVAQGASVDVSASQLANLSVHGGSVNGTDTLQVQVYDGYQWSAAQNISVVTYIDHPPVVTGAPASLRPGQTVAASSLFSVSDPDGDTITQYQITDATAGGAHLLLNGVQQAENTPITVTAAQLAQLQVQGAATSGTNAFTVQAYDGAAWSSAASVNVTTVETPPVVTVTGSLQLNPLQLLGLTSLNLPISVSDADGDPVVTYRFTDVGSGLLTASLLFNGIAIAQGGSIDVAASQLANLSVLGAAINGSDSLQVQVYDGYQWSAAQTISVVSYIDHAPVVGGVAANLRPGQTIAASSLFNVSDADGDTITQYKVTDAAIGGAHLFLNGVQQPENTPITVTAAQLAQLQVQGSATSGTNAFTVQAFDGTLWSSATSVNVTTAETPSVVTVTGSLHLTPGQVLGVTTSNMPVSVSDADGDSVVTYRFTDVGSGATSASLIFNGSAVAQGGSVDVAAAQLANLSVQGGSVNGTDTLQVQVYDGYQWSVAKNISVVSYIDHAPVVTGVAAGLRPNQTIAASSLFSVSDPDGDTITQYQITDTAAGGATLLLNGVAQAANTPITVTAAQLAQLQVQGSATSGASAVTVQAFDGTLWSSAATVNVTTTETASVVGVTGGLQLTPGQVLGLTTSNLPISVSDADGDSVVTYRFTDVGSGATSASLIFNGAAIAQGGSVDVAATQLAKLSVQGGSVNGTDSLQVQVYDGYQWSAAQTISVVSYIDHAPVVSGAAASLRPNQTIAVSSLFNVSDADGDTITQYKITDTTVGGAHLLLNGVQQAENTPITVTAAQLAQLQVQSAVTGGTNSFSVQAFDGTLWSSAATVNVTTTEAPSAVTVTGSLQLITGQVLGLNTSNLPITVSDTDGDPVVTYRFTDVSTAASSAALIFNGTTLAQGASVDVAAAQLTNLSVQGGSGNGTDTLQVQVYDGYQWSAAQNISVATHVPNHAPVVAATAATSLRPDLKAALSLTFSASDADGDTITQYKITDATLGGAHLLLNGVQQAENTTFTVAAANLAQWQVASASATGTNAFTVQAFDGIDWSNATTINLTTAETPSVVSVSGSLLVQPGAWLNVTAAVLPVTVTDADGDPIVSYRFTDVSSAASGAYLWFNGATMAQGATVDVAPSLLSTFWVHGAVGNGTDILQVQAYDGYQWSAAQNITVATRGPNHAPAVTAATTSFGVGQTVAASSIFNVSDADSDPITQYKITDATSGGAHLLLNGVQQADGASFTIAASDLAQWQILTSSVNRSVNSFTVQAYDGYDWSAATSVAVTSMGPDDPSVVNVTGSMLVQPGAWLNVTALPVTVTDADGDPVVTYRFTDVGSGANSAYLWVGGTIAQGGTVDVAASQLSSLWVHGAVANGTDTLQVQVYDGYQWSAAQNISVVTRGPNHAPAITAATTSFGVGQTVAASSIFNVSDADSDPITQYKITDATNGGAHLLLNGVQQTDGASFTIAASDLAQWQILTSSVNRSVNSFTVQAYDGYDWSAATSVAVTSMGPDTPSVIAVNGGLAVQPGAWLDVTAAILPITVTDADGDPVVTYRFTDAGVGANSSYLWFNGATIAQGGSVDVAASQLASLWVHGAAANGTDTLHMQVYDGYMWSAVQDVSVVTHGPNHVPTIAAGTTSLGFSDTVALSSIFSATDADGDAITQYKVSDATVGGAHLLLNGVQQAEGTIFTIDAANLSQWQVATSAVSHDVNQFQVAASDGIGWSSAASINVISGDNAPVETVANGLQLAPSQWLDFNTSNLPLSVTDADGDAIVSYRFTDVGNGSSSAYLWFNGTTLAQGASVDVPAAQLSSFWIRGGATAGIDTLRVQVNDGFAWSAPQDISVITSASAVNANAGAHIVTGQTTGGNDALTGTAASDTFVFAPNFGNDTVNNYTPGQDVIAIDHTVFATASAAVAAATGVAGNAVIHVDANDSITFTGISVATLSQHQNDFHIV